MIDSLDLKGFQVLILNKSVSLHINEIESTITNLSHCLLLALSFSAVLPIVAFSPRL